MQRTLKNGFARAAAWSVCTLALGASTLADTKYYALVIANDEGKDQNDEVKKALEKWNCWLAPSGTIVLRDNQGGGDILNEINAWKANIDGDDVALFYFIGHGGTRADAGGANADEQVNDPVKDNDSKRKVDETIGLKADDVALDAGDDQIKSALGTLPASTTLLAIFDMCYANGEVLGLTDRDVLTNIGVITVCAEANTTTKFFGWTPKFLPGFVDGPDADTKADADADGDDELTVQELFDYAKAKDAATLLRSNLAGGANRPICKTINNGPNPNAVEPNGRNQGKPGTGVGSDPDFGDLPDSYATTLAANGPRYNEWILQRLGTAVDDEIDAQPGSAAASDGADEDGVSFGANSLSVTVTIDCADPADYRLDAWFDVNSNGVFDEPSEHAINSQLPYDGSSGGWLSGLATGSHPIAFALSFDPRAWASRFRLTFGIDTSTAILSYGEYDAGDGGSHGEVEDYAPQPPITSYCTAGISSNGCAATLSGTGIPSASASFGFTIAALNVEGQKQGLMFYGVGGAHNAPWNGSSYLCVKAPTQRTGAQNTGGNSNLCNGTLALDWNAFIANHPGALGTPFVGGETVWAQAWYRDPPAPKTTNLSNGLQFVVQP